MTLILCVDKGFGLMFNNRRQSRDSAVITDIIDKLNGETLFVSEYSAKLFGDFKVSVTDSFTDGVCFVEDKYDSSLLQKAEKLVLYNWGRAYPSDVKTDIDYIRASFTLAESTAIVGTSHNEIVKEVYVK